MTPKHSRRSAIVGLTSAAVAALLAACSAGAPPTAAPPPAPTSPPAPAPTSATAPTQAAPPKPAQAPASKEVVTLRLTHWWGEQFTNWIPILEGKTGIKIEEERAPFAGYSQKLLTQMVGGVGPDMPLLSNFWNGDFLPTGWLAPFDDYLKSANVDMTKWNLDPKVENGYQGKTYGLTLYTAQDMLLHINREIAERDGLMKDLPLWGTPTFDTWRWDKLLEWLKAATKIRSDGTVEQYGLGRVYGDWGTTPRHFVVSNGGQLFDEEWNYTETKALVDQPPFVEAIQFLLDLSLKHKVGPTLDAEAAVQGGSYRAKRAASIISWSTPSSFPETLFKQVQIHLPFSKSKTHGVGGDHLSVNKTSKQVDRALEWCSTFCVDKDNRTKFLEVSSVPSYDPLPIVQSAPEGTPKTIALLNLSRIKGMSPIPANTEGVVVFPQWYGAKASQFTQDTLTAGLQSVLTGKATVQDAMNLAKQKIDAELAKKK